MKTRSTQFFATIVLITGLCTVMVPAHGQPETSADTLDISEIDQIHGKLLLNANIGYNFSPGLKGFLNARNILAQSKREGYGTDKIGTLVLAGINVEF